MTSRIELDFNLQERMTFKISQKCCQMDAKTNLAKARLRPVARRAEPGGAEGRRRFGHRSLPFPPVPFRDPP